MMTINNEKYYTEYEVSVIQELTNILSGKLHDMEWNDCASEHEIHKYIRTEVFDEFYDHLCAIGLLSATAISISEAAYSAQNTSDLDVIDAFCDQKLKELSYKEVRKPDAHEIADIQARIAFDCDMDNWLNLNNIGDCAEYTERNYYLYDLAVEFAGSEWDDSEKSLQDCLEDFCEHKKEELTLKNATYKVGDEVYVLYDFEVQKCYVQDIEFCSDNGISYALGTEKDSHDYDVWESYIYKDLTDIIHRLQEKVDADN